MMITLYYIPPICNVYLYKYIYKFVWHKKNKSAKKLIQKPANYS